MSRSSTTASSSSLRIADGVRRADNLLRPAGIAFRSVDLPKPLLNRRWFWKEGKARPNPFGKVELAYKTGAPGPEFSGSARPHRHRPLHRRPARARRAAHRRLLCLLDALCGHGHGRRNLGGLFRRLLRGAQASPGGDVQDSPGAYFRKLKVEEAVRLIRDEGWQVKQVAYHLGYRHPNDLSRALADSKLPHFRRGG